MKDSLGELYKKIEEHKIIREDNQSDIFNSIKQINVYVRTQLNNQREERETFEENIFNILEDTTKQLSLIK
jgi:hypothetical protein